MSPFLMTFSDLHGQSPCKPLKRCSWLLLTSRQAAMKNASLGCYDGGGAYVGRAEQTTVDDERNRAVRPLKRWRVHGDDTVSSMTSSRPSASWVESGSCSCVTWSPMSVSGRQSLWWWWWWWWWSAAESERCDRCERWERCERSECLRHQSP